MTNDSLYVEYLKERQGIEFLRSRDSFASYRIAGAELFIFDLCVAKSSRKSGQCRVLIDELSAIGLEAGCTHITGNIHVVKDPGANSTLRAALALGFSVLKAQNDILLISKEITED